MSFRAALCAAALVLCASTAQAATSLRTTASTRQAEVGEGIRIEVTAMSDTDDSPSNPRLAAPPGFSVEGPSVGSSQQISFNNGHFEHHRGITATWIVVATRPGRFVVGPATVDVGRTAVVGERIDVEIVDKGAIPRQAPRRRGRFFDPNDPFDPFSMFKGLPGFDDLEPPPILDAPPEAPQAYVVPHAPDPTAFLRAEATPKTAVVGQQVTLDVFSYASRGSYDEVNSSEASRADFLSQSIVDSSFKQPRYIVAIDGVRFMAVRIRQIALFPLHAGNLTIGPMRMGFRGPGYPETVAGSGLVRESQPITIVAVDPPVAGRPPGYELGDVGTYSLTADVEPRRVQAGDAVAVTIRLEGTGNVPHHVKVPEQQGVDFLDPTTKDGLTMNGSTVRGYREFHYVVRLETAGTRDLGAVTLPFFDPSRQAYDVARAPLGEVEVLPGAAAAPSSAPSGAASATPSREPPLAALGAIRKTRGAARAGTRHLLDRPWFWPLVLGAPAVVVALRGLSLLLRRLAEQRAARKSSGTARAKSALADAHASAEKNERGAVATALERAVYTTIEDRLGMKARAVLRPELAAALERRGVPQAVAKECSDVLDACDALRFTSAPEPAPKALVARAKTLTAQLSRVARTETTP